MVADLHGLPLAVQSPVQFRGDADARGRRWSAPMSTKSKSLSTKSNDAVVDGG
jgi:hypothetical protein